MAELGIGYISIVPEVSKISPTISKALQGAEPEADKAGRSFGDRLSSGMGTALKGSVVGVGVATGGLLATAITKGMGRLTGIENAQASLRGLGHDAQSVETIMDSALNAVRGTAYGLDAAASVAASAVAAGIQPGEDLERTLKMTGDAATIAGIEMSAMGSIVNKVATSDMMQMDVANQLMDAGIPILQMVADEMGVTANEAREMASDGKVSFETFQTALEKGVGGAALEAGNTFQGALSNMGAAMGRLGATGLTPFFELTKDGMGVATSAIDGMEAAIKPMAQDVAAWLDGTAVPAIKNFAGAIGALKNDTTLQGVATATVRTFNQIVDAGTALAPVVVNVASAFGQASAALGVSSWSIFVGTLEVAGSALEAVAGPLETVTEFLAEHPGLVASGIVAWAGMKTIPDILGKVSQATLPLVTNTRSLSATMSSLQDYYRSTGREITKYEALMQAASTSSNSTLSGMGRAMNNASVQGGVLARTTGVMKAGFEGAKGAASGLMGLFGGPWGVALAAAGLAVGAVVQANQRASTAQENMASSARDAEQAQLTLQAAVAGTTGALNDQAMTAAASVVKGELAELTEMGEAYSGWLYSVDTDTNVWERMFNIGGQWEEDKAKARAIKEEYEALTKVMEDSGMSMDDLYEVIARGGPEYDDLINKLRATEDGGADAANGLEKVREELVGNIEEARKLDPAIQQGAEAIGILANAAGDADTRLGGLRKLMQAMGLAPKDAEEAMRDASEAILEVVDSAGSMADQSGVLGDSLLDMNGKIDTTTQNGIALYDQLTRLGEELMNVAANGGDVEGKLGEMQPALQTLADEFGLPIEKIQELGRSFGLVPRELQVGVALDGAEGVTLELGNIWQAVEQLPEGQSIRVEAPTEEAVEALELAGFSVENIPGSKHVEVKAETDDAQGEIADVVLKLDELGEMQVSPTALLNDRELITSANNAAGILSALNIQNPTPTAQLIIDDLLNGVNITQGELDFLAGFTATPTADLQTELLEAGVKVSNEMLDNLRDRKDVNTKIDANPKPLTDQVLKARQELDKLPKEVITKLRIQEWREFYTTGTSTGGGGVGSAAVGQHYPTPRGETGGRFTGTSGFSQLPGYWQGGRHGGYRLPATGPGTEVTDGFLALDHLGMPIARLNRNEWVIKESSSEKYDKLLALVNQDHPSIQHLQGLETGGKIGRPASQILDFADGKRVDGEQASRSLQGALYEWAGINWGDCSAAMAGLARFATGVAPFAARFSTGNQDAALAALGFKPGLGDPSKDFSIGWLNGGIGGGHTSGTVAGVNVEMGGGAGGNGKIGGAAAPANHPQYTNHRHLPLAGSGAGGISGDTSVIQSTSTTGVTLENGINVDWGEADKFYEQALGYLQQNTKVYDTGGILPTGGFAFNAGPPERILPAGLTRSFDEFMAMTPGIVAALQRGDTGTAQDQLLKAANVMMEAAQLEAETQIEWSKVEIERARGQVQDTGRNLGGEWLGQAQIVRDAEQGMVDLRKQLVIETINIRRAEEGVKEARESLVKAESEGASLSEATRRRIEDSEEDLRKAREEGKPDKIADAEKKYARVREDAAVELEKAGDKNADNVRKALENMAEAEKTLAEAKDENADAAIRLEAAERTIAASRYQAIADMVTSVSGALRNGVGYLSEFWNEMSRIAGMVEKTRQEVSKLEMQQQNQMLTLQKAQHQLQISELDYQRTRAMGAINLAQAEQNVVDARARAAVLGSTGIEAMSGAMDRFLETGQFSVGELSDSVIENSKLVQEALWGVSKVEAQNALDALNASHAQSEAQFAVAQATLLSVQTAELLQLQTAHLEGQARQLYGMTQNQAQGASKGLGGLGGLLGGIGKLGGGILTGLAGFAAGGPLGAIPGIIQAVGGLGETVKGGIDAWNNRGEIGQAWDGMNLLEKVGLVGGGLLSGAAPIVGGIYGGPEGVALGSQLSDSILDASFGSWQHSITSRIEKQNRDHQDRIDKITLGHDQDRFELDREKLMAEIEYLRERDRLQSDVNFADLMQQAFQTTSDDVTEKILAAAEQEAIRAGRTSAEQLEEMRRTTSSLDEMVTLMRNLVGTSKDDVKVNEAISGAMQKLVSGVAGGLSGFNANQYISARI